MYGYEQRYMPVYAHPRMAQAPAAPAPPPAATPGMKEMAVALGVAETALAAATVWVGVRAGLKEKGFYSALGWIVGGAAGLFGMIHVLGTVGVVKS